MGNGIIEGCTSLQSLTLSAENPPILIKVSHYSPYSFGEGTPEEFRILLTGNASADAYIDKWKYFVAGYEEGAELSGEEELRSINYVRHLFGMEPITELSEKGETENSGETENPGEDGDKAALESAADSVELSDAADGAKQETQIQESKNEIEIENEVENKTEETETQAQDKTGLE